MKFLKHLFYSNNNSINPTSFLAKNPIVSFSLKAANILLVLIANIILANLLVAKSFGIYSFAIAIIAILAISTQLNSVCRS